MRKILIILAAAFINAAVADNASPSAARQVPGLAFEKNVSVTIPPTNFAMINDKSPASIVAGELLGKPLQKLLGKEFDDFREYSGMGPDADVDSSGKEIFGHGQEPHAGGWHEAAFAVDRGGRLYAVILDRDAKLKLVFKVFGASSFEQLPAKLRDFISDNQE